MKKIDVPKFLEIGKHYTNDELIYSLEVGNSGGIRPKVDNLKSLQYIVLITSEEGKNKNINNPYLDRIEGNVLTYTGAGLRGGQEEVGVNRRVLEQLDKPIPILGFVKESTNKYRFIGFLFLLRHYGDFQLDVLETFRSVLIFEFQIVTEVKVVSINNLEIFIPVYTKLKSTIKNDDMRVQLYSDNLLPSKSTEMLKEIEILKNKLLTINPYKFEEVISKLIMHVGFVDVSVTKKSGDDGIDINAILKNLLSLNLKYAFQVKRWKHSVGRNEVANLRGSMNLNDRGVIISTSHFTESAIREAKSENKSAINLVGISELYEVINITKFDLDRYII